MQAFNLVFIQLKLVDILLCQGYDYLMDDCSCRWLHPKKGYFSFFSCQLNELAELFWVLCSDVLRSFVMTFIASHFNTGITLKCMPACTVYKSNKQYVICFKNTAILKIIECDQNVSPSGYFPIEDLQLQLVTLTCKNCTTLWLCQVGQSLNDFIE